MAHSAVSIARFNAKVNAQMVAIATAQQAAAGVLANGTAVKVDQGFGRFTLGTVQGHSGTKYDILVTGGVNLFGKPATVGSVAVVSFTHVSAY